MVLGFGTIPTIGVVLRTAGWRGARGTWETQGRCSKLHSALLSWYLAGITCRRRQSEKHISEDGREVMWAKPDFAPLRVGKG